MIYDVIIVGAGTNGGTAAFFLAKKGFKTLLIETSKTPGEKCQGATEYAPRVIYHSRPELIDLMVTVLKKIPNLHPGDLGRAHHYYYVNKDNDVVFKSCAVAPGKTGKEVSYGVHNQDFVRALAEEVVKAGAELKTGTTVVDVIREGDVIKGVVTEEGEEIRARLTIGADGRISTIAKKAGLLKKWDINVCTYQYGEAWKFRSEEEMFDYVEYARHMFFGSSLTPPKPWGACTMSPRPGGIVTVNAPTSWTPLSSMVSSKKNSRHVYMQNLYKIMEVKRMLRPCEGFPEKPFQRQSTFMPGPPLKKPYMAGLIICGDAGGMGGLCGAGELAAKYVAPLLEQGDVSEQALAGFTMARLPSGLRGFADTSDTKYGKNKTTVELSEVSPTRIVHWSAGAGYVEKYQCSLDEMVANMQLAAVPHVMGAPSPEKCGEFGYIEMGAWLIAVKISHLLKLYGPILQDPNMFPSILKWVQKNQQSFNEKKVFDHPF
jgi:flavin-dependent dehydrogenase